MILDAMTYCRTRLKALGRTEWRDPKFVNIPRPRLDKAFHLTLEPSTGVSNNQDNQVTHTPVTVRLTYAPSRKPDDIADAATKWAHETVVADFLNPRNRLTQVGVKNVTFNTLAIEPLDGSNDNGVIVRLVFTMLVITSTR